MRPVNKNSIFYAPGNIPNDLEGLGRYLQDELYRIQATFQALAAGHIDMTYVAPDKPREGDIRLADGTDWDPGSGQGLYCYYNGVWNKL